MATRGEPTKEFIYLGTVEVNRGSITLNPEPEDPTLQVLIINDLVNETGWHSPWEDSTSPHDVDPAQLLDLLAGGVFETFLDEIDDEQRLVLVREALAEGPYTGALYAVGIALLPLVAVRFSATEPLAFRNGETWRDPSGLPLDGGRRTAAIQVALEDIKTRNPWGL